MKKKSKVIAIASPTATGKSKLAVEIAKKIDGEIVSADSRLVYKGFEIAVAKPTIEEMQGVPHYLIDVVEPEFDYSVANFLDDATLAIENIILKGKTPIIVGGTGLYFRVLLEGYDIPRVAPDYDLRNELEEKSYEELVEILKNLDNKTLSDMKEASKRKLIRTIEICKGLEKPLSEYSLQKEPPYEVISTEWTDENDLAVGRTPDTEAEVVEVGHRHADEIIILEGGKVVERGTHDSLMEKKGRYYDTFVAQYERPEELMLCL